jgi:hypothetical protein
MPNMDAPLTREEFQSLRDVSKRAMQPVIPADHETKLQKLGFIKRELNGLMLTDAGQLRLAMGK